MCSGCNISLVQDVILLSAVGFNCSETLFSFVASKTQLLGKFNTTVPLHKFVAWFVPSDKRKKRLDVRLCDNNKNIESSTLWENMYKWVCGVLVMMCCNIIYLVTNTQHAPLLTKISRHASVMLIFLVACHTYCIKPI